MYDFDFELLRYGGFGQFSDFSSPDTNFVFFKTPTTSTHAPGDKSKGKNVTCFLKNSSCQKVTVHKISTNGMQNTKSTNYYAYQHKSIFSDTVNGVECRVTTGIHQRKLTVFC